jgi:hypothetical protein
MAWTEGMNNKKGVIGTHNVGYMHGELRAQRAWAEGVKGVEGMDGGVRLRSNSVKGTSVGRREHWQDGERWR